MDLQHSSNFALLIKIVSRQIDVPIQAALNESRLASDACFYLPEKSHLINCDVRLCSYIV